MPKQDDEEKAAKRDERIGVPVSQAEYDLIKKLGDYRGLGCSSLLRMLGLDAAHAKFGGNHGKEHGHKGGDQMVAK